MSKRLNPPGVLPVTEIIKKAESVLQNLSAQLDWNISCFEITLFTAFSLSTFSGRSGHVLFFVREKLLLLRLACVWKDDFVRAGTQTSYVSDEAVKSRERAAILSACRSLVCLCTHTIPPATQPMLRHIMCPVPATMRDVGVYVNQKVR